VCNFRWTMQARRLICSTGPTSQLRSISQFIACCPPEVGSIPLPWQPCNLYLGGLCRLPTGSTHYGLQAVFPGRHKGMGSLPSARITACSVRITGLPGALLLGIAQYSPHRAKAVSKNSTVLFIGGASESRSFSAWPGVYALASICGGPTSTQFAISSIPLEKLNLPRRTVLRTRCCIGPGCPLRPKDQNRRRIMSGSCSPP
jgi:hypothetical protein